MQTTGGRYRPWAPGVTYVVGHQHPDTDAIAAAMGFAWYLAARGEQAVVAARAGQPAPETAFALERFGQSPPLLLTEVGPTMGHAARPQRALPARAPLGEALPELAAGARVVPVLDKEGRPLGALTSTALARALGELATSKDAFARPCSELAESLPTFRAGERIRDHRPVLAMSEVDDFLVVDSAGRYHGVASRARVLEPPRARLLLVDHNELAQAVPGAEEAEIVGVLDHHRLANPDTVVPIPFVVEPVGSTSTLVGERCRAAALEPPAGLAGMLLSGILSDTLAFRSVTTTDRDRDAASWLAGLAGVDARDYGDDLLHAAPGLAVQPVEAILDTDRKNYQLMGQSVSIAQVEVPSLWELPERRAELLAALQERREREALALIGLMVTDVLAGRSHFLCQGEPWILEGLPFRCVGENEFDLGRMLSRKQQLLPVLSNLFEHAL